MIQNFAMSLLQLPYLRTAFELCQAAHILRSLLAQKRQVFRPVSEDTGQALQDQ